jgi:hypothetical protein
VSLEGFFIRMLPNSAPKRQSKVFSHP